MTRSQTLESNAYDVLGVSPNASAEAIDDAFHRLIDGGDYRVGVPLRGQWLRAHQIKQAYAMLGEPAKRRAYDESLKAGAEGPPWPAESGDNPSLSALLRPVGDERESAPAIGLGNDEIEPHVDQRAAWPGPGERERKVDDETVADDPEPSPDDEFIPDDAKFGPGKFWGSAAAAALAIGSLLYFSWPGVTPQLPVADTGERLLPGMQRLDSQARAQPAERPAIAKALTSEVATEAPGELSPVAEGVSEPLDTPGRTETAGPAAADTRVANATESETRTNMAAADQAATASTPTETASPSATAPAAIPPAALASRPGAGVVGSPAQLVGGGPTRLDNPRGRHVGTVVVQFTVQADGRVSNCGPVRSSGKADLDSFTCRLVEQRMRFRPALDAQGNPVASTAHARYEWGRRRRHPSLLSWIFR